MVLSMAVLFVYYKWFNPPIAPVAPAAVQQVVTPPEISPPVTPVTESKVIGLGQPRVSDEEIEIETEKVRAVFSTKGAYIKKWVLKEFHQTADVNTPNIELINESGFAMDLSLGQELSNYVLEERKDTADDHIISFKAQGGDFTIWKIFTLRKGDPYEVDLTFKVVSAKEGLLITPQIWNGLPQKADVPSGMMSFIKGPPDMYFPLTFADNNLETVMDPEEIKTSQTRLGAFRWVALSDRYFLAALLSRVDSTTISAMRVVERNQLRQGLSYGSATLSKGESYERSYSVYLGPKLREKLAHLGVGLEKSVDYGWFWWVAIPLLNLLIFFQKLVVNWGIAIILLTFVVKLLLHPINKKSMESMKAMQKLQPQLKELQKKHKGDKAALNAEMMQMFKTNKVNPMGGCLPMIIQMPVYIALYKVLWNAIELYHAPFFGFYRDLSAPDPYFIGPVLLGGLMFLQQKFTPTATAIDPAQQKVMMFMPLMFSVFMVFLPAGLVLYIMVNTLMSVIQQYMIQHDLSFAQLIKSKVGRRPV